MNVYLVGGAVRDQLLGLPVTERDWVVVGETPQAMLQRGYQQVGKDFPVFLHPKTGEEYALARTERKSGRGYTGFTTYSAPDVTLEDDLLRRDLTINAIAQDSDGNLIDPFNGQADLKQKRLRHVSQAFVEDPLRVLRLARFAARFCGLDFKVADATTVLCRRITREGELAELTAERVWQECFKALKTNHPEAFFAVLRDCGGLKVLFPELDQLYGVPNPPHHHPEIDSGVHTMMVLQQAVKLTDDPMVRFAALVHDLGKGVTDPAHWPKHHGHEKAGIPLIQVLCERYRIPKAFKRLAEHVSQFHLHCHKIRELNPKTIVNMLESLDAFRRPSILDQFIPACQADAQGRTGYENNPYPQADHLKKLFAAAQSVNVQDIIATGKQGAEIKEALHRQRIKKIAKL